MLTGCKTGPPKANPKPLNVHIQPAGEAARLTVHVYVGAANQYAKQLKEADVDRLLAELKNTPTNSPEFISFQLTDSPRDITTKDKHWEVWRGPKNADCLVVIADLPRHLMRQGLPDPRRVEVPLDKNLWKNLQQNTVHVEISEKEVKLLDNPGQ